MKKFTLTPQALFLLLIHTHFQDVLPEFNGAYAGTLQEFTLVDNVSMMKGTPILDIFKKANILRRADQNCEVDWSKIARSGNRKITVDEMYGATKICEREFYQGCLKDFTDGNPKFRDFILTFFKGAFGQDIATNAYFGDVTRASDSEISWNIVDGIFIKLRNYIALNNPDYKPTLGPAIPSGDLTPAQCYGVFKDMIDAQTTNLENATGMQKYFTCDYDMAKGLWRYYQSIGENAGNLNLYQQGQPSLKIDDVPVMVEPTFKPLLKKLNGGEQAHSCVLTLRKNFIWGTNKDYNHGLLEGKAMKVWYDEDEFSWKYLAEAVGGTEIVSPKDVVIAQTNGVG
ncbi:MULTISPECIES: hypothetical protein [Chryseobacterium]|uniref:Uncharacterized protein n=1 Tax=Chryseobacterium gambrini TaxID=373672 RepID=A0A1N7LE36_9FLAO|nr:MULTISPECIES: hypothetical protein [Chryseobacterium]SIS72047.1 hypothetical protein SAMN05421785_102171 [Chryseobacterium gambrini]